MRIIVYVCNSYSDYDVCDVMNQMGIEYRLLEYKFSLSGEYANEDDKFVRFFCDSVDTRGYDAVFSIGYWPPLALACYKKNMKYVAWSYDCPFHIQRVEDTLLLPNVYCFTFDKEQYCTYASMGIDNIYHMPLGVNSKRYRNITPNTKNKEKYGTQVSFVGKLYDNNSYPIIQQNVNERTRMLLDNIIQMQYKMPTERILDQVLTDGIVELINKEMHVNNPKFTDTATKDKIRFAIEEQITFSERLFLLNMCGRKYKTDFYTSSESDFLENVNCHGEVSYRDEMPLIFSSSDINLNQTLKSIHFGVSLRVFDIVASGGFILTNRQPELEELFTEDEDVGVYESIYDFPDKLDYYMTHDEKRNQIIRSGRARCLEEHSIINRLSRIFEISKIS